MKATKEWLIDHMVDMTIKEKIWYLSTWLGYAETAVTAQQLIKEYLIIEQELEKGSIKADIPLDI